MTQPKPHVVVDVRVYQRTHGAMPRGRGHWAFVMGRVDYDYADQLDDVGRPLVYWPTAPSGMRSADMPYALAKRYAVDEARRRGVTLIGVAP